MARCQFDSVLIKNEQNRFQGSSEGERTQSNLCSSLTYWPRFLSYSLSPSSSSSHSFLHSSPLPHHQYTYFASLHFLLCTICALHYRFPSLLMFPVSVCLLTIFWSATWITLITSYLFVDKDISRLIVLLVMVEGSQLGPPYARFRQTIGPPQHSSRTCTINQLQLTFDPLDSNYIFPSHFQVVGQICGLSEDNRRFASIYLHARVYLEVLFFFFSLMELRGQTGFSLLLPVWFIPRLVHGLWTGILGQCYIGLFAVAVFLPVSKIWLLCSVELLDGQHGVSPSAAVCQGPTLYRTRSSELRFFFFFTHHNNEVCSSALLVVHQK
ncbi:hypothetical protein ASPCAL13630 [Aspergillus calidoustus]|uniref:Uncharacterized protein n=1 Tax=Aspergillus calidoustus TaxID=454130 RepID=A0A0U5GFF8_ASPCI|nr:hypothetical protein ASPCAL13630 [Aspergillus calidoustus]